MHILSKICLDTHSFFRFVIVKSHPDYCHVLILCCIIPIEPSTAIHDVLELRTSKLQTYIHSCTRFHGNDVIYTLNIHDNNQEGTEQFLCKWSASKNAWYVLIFMCYIWYVRKELSK